MPVFLGKNNCLISIFHNSWLNLNILIKKPPYWGLCALARDYCPKRISFSICFPYYNINSFYAVNKVLQRSAIEPTISYRCSIDSPLSFSLSVIFSWMLFTICKLIYRLYVLLHRTTDASLFLPNNNPSFFHIKFPMTGIPAFHILPDSSNYEHIFIQDFRRYWYTLLPQIDFVFKKLKVRKSRKGIAIKIKKRKIRYLIILWFSSGCSVQRLQTDSSTDRLRESPPHIQIFPVEKI